MRIAALALSLLLLFTHAVLATDAPAQEPTSKQFTVSVNSASVPVYLARVCSLSVKERETLGMPQIEGTTETSFAGFDISGKTTIEIHATEPVQTVKVLPTSAAITPTINGNTITFTLDHPGQFVVEVNGDWLHSLQLFADPPETDAPKADDPNVIYFAPGVHAIDPLKVPPGKTLYVARGAVLYAKPANNAIAVLLEGSNITLRGRGIIDGSLVPRGGGRNLLAIWGQNIHVEGVTLRDSCEWTCRLGHSENVNLTNVKIFGWRGNSDGMDICNSKNVTVTDCFLRTFDDLVVIKSNVKGDGPTENVSVKHCVLWNEFAHALSLGAEMREPVSNVTFSDCDVIHDKGREWNLRVYQCDSGAIHNITFDNIRIEEDRKFISLWIGKAIWSNDTERGTIASVTFSNITTVLPTRMPSAPAEFKGFDAEHGIAGVQLNNIKLGDRTLANSDVYQNEFVKDVTIKP